ncbi:MAG: hypothetical protein ACLPWF_07565 [Bryobacteraceae bacterium]
MLSSTKRRISVLERSIELPITAERFLASVQDRVRLTGASFDEVFRSSLASLSYENLCRLEKEVMQRVRGDDLQARDVAVRNASTGAVAH